MMRAKKIKGKKRHILVDTLGLLLHAVVHPADIQIVTGVLVLSTLFGLYPFCKSSLLMGISGPGLSKGFSQNPAHLQIEIVKRSDQAKGFELLPRLVCRTHFRLA